jgi:formylglycine-generating enzyme required for sulfatase activity
MKQCIISSVGLAVLAGVSLITPLLAEVNIDYVSVGNTGNAADPASGSLYGAVSYAYRIARNETTISQYCEFLNAVAKTDTYSLYRTDMSSVSCIAGINRDGSPGSYSYAPVVGTENKPITYVSWFDAARFTNWLHNGQPTGAQDAGTTEDGAYTLNGATSGVGVSKNFGAKVWIPSEDEWYKAAYYDPNKGGVDVGGYWLYPTQSDTLGGNTIGVANSANYYDGDYVGYPGMALTDVGAYGLNSDSAYGTNDQGGNVWEWNDAVISGSSRGVRGGAWDGDGIGLASSYRFGFDPSGEFGVFGFRVASVEPPIAIANVRAAQRAGTKLVDIDFDIINSTAPVTVSLQISADGGTTWAVPATTLSGAVGASVAPGNNLRITWDADTDWDKQTSSRMRFRLELTTELAEFSLIPAGSFTMGDSLDGMADATPHTVNVSEFYMQKMETTKAQWDEVRTWGALHGYTDLSDGVGTAANHPVQTVSWYDVVKWCNAKSEKEGLTPCYFTDAARTAVYRLGNTDIDNTMVKWSANGYRLPTEAEWEKAARGGLSGKRYPLGDSITSADANYNRSVGSATAVGTYAPSGYGLYDMAGNAWEWCWDWYSTSYYGIPGSLTDPAGPSGSNRVDRGGGFDGSVNYCRVAFRDHVSPSYTAYAVGFRPVRTNSVTAESPDTAVDTTPPTLTILPMVHGSVSGAGQYALNTTVELTATADPGYLFSEWTGDATGSSNPLSILLNSNKTIGATFEQDLGDSDTDGLTNYQELAVYHTNPNLKDSDGDGFHDGYEVEHGYSPTNPASKPDTRMVIYTAVEVRFGAGDGKFYRIESSFDNKTWTPVESGIAGTGGEVTRFYTIQAMPKRFFRAVAE